MAATNRNAGFIRQDAAGQNRCRLKPAFLAKDSVCCPAAIPECLLMPAATHPVPPDIIFAWKFCQTGQAWLTCGLRESMLCLLP